MEDSNVPPEGNPSRPPGTRNLIRNLVLALATLAILGALVWLFGSEGQQPQAPTNVKDLPRVDGTLIEVEARRLVMRPFEPLDGSEKIEFTIVDKYAKNFDLAHLRSHSSVAIPTRIYYLKRDGEYLAVYKTDAPANDRKKDGS